jgi:hypothetical protein
MGLRIAPRTGAPLCARSCQFCCLARWDHQVRLDDARGINYAADGSVVGIEIISPRRKGVLLDGLPFAADVARVARSVGFRVIERSSASVG